jgi:hypothetical protein
LRETGQLQISLEIFAAENTVDLKNSQAEIFPSLNGPREQYAAPICVIRNHAMDNKIFRYQLSKSDPVIRKWLLGNIDRTNL